MPSIDARLTNAASPATLPHRQPARRRRGLRRALPISRGPDGCLRLAPLYGAQRAAAVSSGFAKDCFEGVQALILLFAFGYARLYFDGPERQPLMLCFGGVGKVAVAAWFTRVHCTIRACDPSPFPPALQLLVTLPDALLGLCFLREWRRLGYALCETKRM